MKFLLYLILNIVYFTIVSTKFHSFFDDLRPAFNPDPKSKNPIHGSYEIVDRGGMEYCDGVNSFTTNHLDCKYGYAFGQNIPNCICFRGLYRMILDDCFESDGLSEGEICTRPFDTQRESGAKIYTIQMTEEINWDHTHVVCEKEEKPGIKIWWATPLRGNNKSVSVVLPGEEPDFYIINGIPYIMEIGPGKQEICVEERYVQSYEEEKVCRYFRNDNDNWRTEKSIEIKIIKEKCPNNSHALIPSECFPSVRKEASECVLSCDKRGLSVYDPLKLPLNQRRRNENSQTTTESEIVSGSLYSRHDNLYLDRKMLQHLLVSNLRDLSPIQNKPSKTFDLLRQMKNITNVYCPSKYVDHGWIDYVLELFEILHLGGGFVYEDILTDEHYEWAKSILSKCLQTVSEFPLTLTPMPIDSGNSSNKINTESGEETNNLPNEDEIIDDPCYGDSGEAWGYCPNGNCDIMSVVHITPDVDHSDAILKEKHYVPELVWYILDISQSLCFNDFNTSYRIFHILQQSVEKLFTNQIKNLWFYPPYNGVSSRVKSQLLGKGSDVLMHNLEVCTASSYRIVNKFQETLGTHGTPIPRLKRPQPESPFLNRKKRSTKSKSISSYVDAYCLTRSKDYKYPDSCFKKS